MWKAMVEFDKGDASNWFEVRNSDEARNFGWHMGGR